MRQVPFEVLMHAENALAYSNQALAMLEVWMDSLGEGDEHESNCVAAIHSLVHESKAYLQKATEVQSAK
ncbi:TPA: hypothetical protein ACG099_003833 [Salmonella enterica subsp. enterica serovar Meleagridis]|uniref:hypothetical protein n=1 Tax=Enterobacteriaceae TaxID=543 RepID=UPI0012AC40BB|nr:hypothetical protein [Enterobacter hormaechei]EAX9770400.1 hypothetical protein [Salmonella enterica]EJD3719789.1 hypothetical protein [Salmonella enterica]MBJ6543778.1 hypothetical protein [Enterobacter hormaechei]GJL40731.1 hypothetical protein TUM17577_19400 [Enterobacter asburiae]